MHLVSHRSIEPAHSRNLVSRTGSRIDQIRINELSREIRTGVSIWRKRRSASSKWLVPVANLFFRLAGNPVRVLPTGQEWQRREKEIFRLLNGDDKQCGGLNGKEVFTQALSGRDLVSIFERDELDCGVLLLIGEGFHEMHQKFDPHTGQPFTHGDPHLGNVIYNHANQGIGWIDFETTHIRALSAEERRADDLLVFLLDLAGRVNFEQWQAMAPAFLEGYASLDVLKKLAKRLKLPFGLGAVWWSVRTSYLPRQELRKRIEWLRTQI